MNTQNFIKSTLSTLIICAAFAAPAAMASAITFAWQTPAGLEIPNSATPVTGTLVLNVSSQTTSGPNTILTGAATSFTLSDGGSFAVISALPSGSSWTYNTTTGILSTPVTDGAGSASITTATSIVPPTLTVGTSVSSSELLPIPSAVSGLLAPVLQGSTELSLFALASGSVTATLGLSGLSITSTGTAANLVGAFGYFKLAATPSTVPVPVPASLPLLLSGVFGLSALVRRQKRISA